MKWDIFYEEILEYNFEFWQLEHTSLKFIKVKRLEMMWTNQVLFQHRLYEFESYILRLLTFDKKISWICTLKEIRFHMQYSQYPKATIGVQLFEEITKEIEDIYLWWLSNCWW